MAAAGTPGRVASLAAQLAACTGSEHPVLAGRIVTVTGDDGPAAAAGPLTVGAVAAAVDAGREQARAAAADEVTVLVGASDGATAAAAAVCLAAWLTGLPPGRLLGPDDDPSAIERALALHLPAIRGPLGALRRLGDEPAATLCGLALGAGEHGLAFVCDGPAATAAAGIAVAIEPPLAGRLLAAGRPSGPAHAALLAHLGLEPIGDDGAAALDALRAAL